MVENARNHTTGFMLLAELTLFAVTILSTATASFYAHRPLSDRWLGAGIPILFAASLLAGALVWLVGYSTFKENHGAWAHRDDAEAHRAFKFSTIAAVVIALIGIFGLGTLASRSILGSPGYQSPITVMAILSAVLFFAGSRVCKLIINP